jgi:ATP-dependent Lhr-like helicase
VPRYLSSQAIDDTLEHAILDSPMFQARWRWNLNRSLMVLRFRNGKKNPPMIQRMESDDLMVAVFPQAAACQDNAVGPIEIPNHVLVRQTIADTLYEGLDADGLRELLERIEDGDVKVHFAETIEPSVLAHEILTARPYAFLDDEEFQNRRTNAVTLRRGLSVDLASIGALEPATIEQVHAEIEPDPSSPDDLHDLLSSLGFTRARDDWRDPWNELVARGRGRVLHHDGTELWCTTEASSDADRAIAGEEDAIAAVLRGHLEISGITSVDSLAKATTLRPSRVEAGLAVLEHEGFALQGRYTPDAVDTEWPNTEWVARRLLARMHSYSRRTRRQGVEPATAQDFMRFLLRWQHVAPDTQLAGEAGLAAALEQLQGHEAAAVAWEPDLLARRLRHYDPAWLDRLCHNGEVSWLRLTPRARDDANTPAGPPSKATPITVVYRNDLAWLLEAARSGSGDPAEPAVGATAEVVEVLRERGACFAAELGDATNRLPEDIERALWDGVSRGLLTSDGFGAIRSRVSSGGRNGTEARRLSRLRRGSRAPGAAAGRWSLVPATGTDIDHDELAEAVAELLLNRWGVVFRDLALHDSVRFPWRDIQWALRRLEDRGLVRGGRFVTGSSGEQYALPQAIEQLTQMRKTERTGERVVVNGTDPLNLVGIVVPGATVPSIRTRQVIYVDGVPQELVAAEARSA